MVGIFSDGKQVPTDGIMLKQSLDLYASELIFSIQNLSLLRPDLELRIDKNKYRLYPVSVLEQEGKLQVMCHSYTWYSLQQKTFGPICKRCNFQQYVETIGIPVNNIPNSVQSYYSHPAMSITEVLSYIDDWAFLDGGGVKSYIDAFGNIQVVDLKKSFDKKHGVPFTGERRDFKMDVSWRKDVPATLEAHFYTEDGFDIKSVNFNADSTERRVLQLVCNKDQEESEINFFRNAYYRNYYSSEIMTFDNVKGPTLLPGSMVVYEKGKRLWMIKSVEGMIDSNKGGLRYTIMSCPD